LILGRYDLKLRQIHVLEEKVGDPANRYSNVGEGLKPMPWSSPLQSVSPELFEISSTELQPYGLSEYLTYHRFGFGQGTWNELATR
jgi:hypothetical protein